MATPALDLQDLWLCIAGTPVENIAHQIKKGP